MPGTTPRKPRHRSRRTSRSRPSRLCRLSRAIVRSTRPAPAQLSLSPGGVMKRLFTGGLNAALLLIFALPAAAETSHEQLVSLAQDYVYTSARVHPMFATALGIAGHDGELEMRSEAWRAADVTRYQQWLARLDSTTAAFTADTSMLDRDDARLLKAQLTHDLNDLLVYQSDRKDYSAPGNSVVNAVFIQFQHLPVPGRDGATAADQRRAWGDITHRLSLSPAYITAYRGLVTQPCHLFGIIGSKELAGAPEFLTGALSDAARAQLGARSADYARFIKARDGAVKSIAELKAYIDAHASEWPEN